MASTPTLYGRGNQPRESSQRVFSPLFGGVLCLDFINTIDDHSGSAQRDDLAPGYVNIVEWLEYAGMLDADAVRSLLRKASKEPREAAAVRKRATTLRAALFEIVTALTTGVESSHEPLAVLNQEIHHSMLSGRYVPGPISLEWSWDDGNQLDRVLWDVCQSAAGWFSSEQVVRVRQCAAPNCQRFFLDTSKNGSRQFCSSSGCGTATRVRRFRERQKTDS